MASSRSEFHRLLRNYINTGCLDRGQVLRSFFSSSHGFDVNASSICEGFTSMVLPAGDVPVRHSWQRLEPGTGHLAGLRQFLQPVADELHSVIIHGSQADGRTTGYSDLDAMVVLSDAVFSDPQRLSRVAKKLSAARRFMFLTDPLQHHGWFVITARDLAAFPESVLPFSALSDAKVLIGADALHIGNPVVNGSAYRTEALRVMTGIFHRLAEGWRPSNAYATKSFLSECMMLPVLYLQARDRKGSSKRDSFAAASVDFLPEEWSIIGELSAIRSEWDFRPSAAIRPILLSTTAWSWELRKRLPIPVPAAVGRRWKPESYLRVMTLIQRMKERLDRH